MAFEVPQPRSYQATLGDMLAAFSARYGITRLKVGGAILSAFEAAAQSDVRSTQDVFGVLDLEDSSRLRGSALEFKARSEGLERLPATPSSGTVDITETRFAKIYSRIYGGTPSPPAGSTAIRVANALSFPSSGSIYIGRGTLNSEGPLVYTAKANLGQYWQLTLSAPTQRFHNTNEEVVVSQGGNRSIAIGSVISTARDGRSTPVDFQTTTTATILDGEVLVRNVSVVCRQPGTVGNVPFGAVRVFSSNPFPGAGVTNPRSFDNGVNVESDDELVDRLRKAKASKSRGTETAILFGTQGVFSSDESKRVLSASLVRPAGEPAVLYIDDGTGYEEANVGISNDILADSAAGGEQYFSLTSRRPIAKAYVKSGSVSPFSLTDGAVLAVMVGGVLNEHTFSATDFAAITSAITQEVVSSINANPNIDFSARAADGGSRVVVFARADVNEDIQIVEPQADDDANDSLVFSTSPTFTLKLYKNDILLYKDGREAVIVGAAQSLWASMSTGIQLNVAVDGTPAQTYVFVDDDFVGTDTGFTTVSQTNSIDAWVTVINAKIPGITAENAGGYILLKSNRGRLSTASIVLSAPSGANLISSGMFTSSLGLSATGLNRDYTLDRMTAQIKLTVPLVAGDSLTVGSTATRGYVQSDGHDSTTITLASTARLWVGVDGEARRIATNTTAATQYTTTVLDPERTKYVAGVATAFGTSTSLLQVGDHAIIWDPALNAHGVFRICQLPTAASAAIGGLVRTGGNLVTVTTAAPHGFTTGIGAYITTTATGFATGSFIITVTGGNTFTYAEAGANGASDAVASATQFNYFVIERPQTAAQAAVTLTSGGLRFFRLNGGLVQELRLAAGTNRALTSIASEINTQLIGARASTYRNIYLRLATNDYSATSGDISVLTADIEGQKLGLPLAQTDASVLSHLAFAQSAPEVGTPFFASTAYVDWTNGDLLDSTGDDKLAFTAVGPGNIADAGDLAYFMRQVQEFDATLDRFGASVDRHYPIVSSFYGTVSRFRLRKNDQPKTLTSLSRAGTTVTGTIAAGHNYVVGDLLRVQHLSTADGNFPSGIYALTAATATTFAYTQAGAAVAAVQTYTSNLWDGTLEGSPSQSGDGFVRVSPFALTPRDSLNVVLNGDEINQSYSIAMRRRLLPTSTSYLQASDINVVDADNGGAPLSTLFGTGDATYFTDFWAFMRARTVSHKNVPAKAAIWRSTRFGPEHNALRISYANPRNQDTSIGHETELMSDGTLNIRLFMPHGAARGGLLLETATRFIWNVTSIPPYKLVDFIYSAPNIAIGGLDRTSNVVTATTAVPHGFSAGETVYLSSTDPNYPAGAKILVSASGTTFVYNEVGTDVNSLAVAQVSSATAAPNFASVQVGDVAIIEDDGTGGLEPVGSWRIYPPGGGVSFSVRVPASNSIASQATPQRLGSLSNLTFAPIDVANSSVQDFIDYVVADDDIGDLIGGTPLGGGAGVIDTSTADEYFQGTNNTGVPSSVDRWSFTDGLNFVLTSNLGVVPNTIQFKHAPGSVELQSGVDFVDEEIQLVPVTAARVAKWLNTPAISGAYTTTDFEVVGRDQAVQATSRIQGSTGGIRVTGGLANETQVVLLGAGENYLSTYGRLLAATSDTLGLTGRQWVALTNSEPTPKTLPLTAANTIQLASNGTITFNATVTSEDGIGNLTAGDMVTIQRVGNFVAYIFMSTAVFNGTTAVGNWIDFQLPNANSSNRGRRRIVGSSVGGAYQYIWVENANGVSEIVEASGASDIQIFTANSILPGDTLEIGYAVGGFANNQGVFVVQPGGSSTSVVVDHAFTPVGPVAIGTNLTAIRVTEPGFRLIERIAAVVPNPDDFSQSYITLDAAASRTLLDHLSPTLGGTLEVLDKMSFPDDPSIGADGYAISTGLIGQVAKVLYGDNNSPTLFPGLVAVGATVFISGPNVKRISISLQIRIRTGVPQTTLVERVRAAVASEINRIPLGTAVDISRLIAAARRVQGVVSVVVLSPTYGVGNDTISVQANEKPFVFSPQEDIAVTVIT